MLPDQLNSFADQKRLAEVGSSRFFKDELETLRNTNVAAYYLHIVTSVDIDRSNPNNSYVMWVCGKVDDLDNTKPASILAGNISLPDIDMDVPACKREEVIEYIRQKYGKQHVSQISTFGRMQGRSSLKEVLRVYDACSFGEMNEITKDIPDEARISDQLQEMDEDERSIIMWALQNNVEELRDYCRVTDDGTLEGDYAEYFDKAIRMEGTYKSQGKHAAGVIISADVLADVCPMISPKDGEEKITSLEMNDLDSIGQLKVDVLSLSLLDKLMLTKEMAK